MAVGWKTESKTWSSNTRPASIRAWTFTSIQPLLVGNHLLSQIKAQGKMRWRTSARGLTISLLDWYQSVSGGKSSGSAFSFPFGCFLCTERQNTSLCGYLFPPAIWQGAQHKRQWCYLSGRKRTICWINFLEEKRGKKRMQENHFVQLTGERKELSEIISQGRDRLLLPGPNSCLLRIGAW